MAQASVGGKAVVGLQGVYMDEIFINSSICRSTSLFAAALVRLLRTLLGPCMLSSMTRSLFSFCVEREGERVSWS